MTDLSSSFLRDQTQHLDLSVPLPALRVMQVFADIIGDKDICIALFYKRYARQNHHHESEP